MRILNPNKQRQEPSSRVQSKMQLYIIISGRESKSAFSNNSKTEDDVV